MQEKPIEQHLRDEIWVGAKHGVSEGMKKSNLQKRVTLP